MKPDASEWFEAQHSPEQQSLSLLTAQRRLVQLNTHASAACRARQQQQCNKTWHYMPLVLLLLLLQVTKPAGCRS